MPKLGAGAGTGAGSGPRKSVKESEDESAMHVSICVFRDFMVYSRGTGRARVCLSVFVLPVSICLSICRLLASARRRCLFCKPHLESSPRPVTASTAVCQALFE